MRDERHLDLSPKVVLFNQEEESEILRITIVVLKLHQVVVEIWIIRLKLIHLIPGAPCEPIEEKSGKSSL